MKLEEKAIPDLRGAIAHAESVQDYVTRDMLRAILVAEEEHVDFIEIQLDLINRMGLSNYVQLQSGSAS